MLNGYILSIVLKEANFESAALVTKWPTLPTLKMGIHVFHLFLKVFRILPLYYVTIIPLIVQFSTNFSQGSVSCTMFGAVSMCS